MKRSLVPIFIFILLLILGKELIYTTTIDKAVERYGLDREMIILINSDKSTGVNVVLVEEGAGWVNLLSVNRGLLGWRVIDQAGLEDVHDQTTGFSGSQGIIQINRTQHLDYVLGIIVDEQITNISLQSSETEKELLASIAFSKQGTRIYYLVTDHKLRDVAYYASSSTGEILYIK